MRIERAHTYRSYAIGCAVAWGVLWLVVGTQASHEKRRRVLLVFAGWLIGWTSATIARAIYPPPARGGYPPPARGGAKQAPAGGR